MSIFLDDDISLWCLYSYLVHDTKPQWCMSLAPDLKQRCSYQVHLHEVKKVQAKNQCLSRFFNAGYPIML
jgi:hypothetical protein